jgi:hypothetical protein
MMDSFIPTVCTADMAANHALFMAVMYQVSHDSELTKERTDKLLALVDALNDDMRRLQNMSDEH